MSIQTVPIFELPKLSNNVSTTPSMGGSANLNITLTGGSMSYIWQMPYTVLIDSIFFRLDTIPLAAGSPTARLLAEIETVNLNSGTPTGLLIDPSASAISTLSFSTVPVNYEVRFPQPFTILQGQHFSITLSLSTGLVSGAGIQLAAFDDDNSGCLFPYMLDDSTPPAAVGIRNAEAPCIGIGLSAVSATPLPFCWPMNNTPPAISFTAPQMHGNKITINAPIRACGAIVWGQVATASSSIILYDTNGTSVLARQPWHHNLPNSTTVSKFNVLFDQPVNLNAGTYYLAVSGGGGSTVGMYYASFSSSFWRMASPMGGTDVVYVSSNASSGNPNWDTVNTRQTFIGLLVDGVDDGASAATGGETSSVFAA